MKKITQINIVLENCEVLKVPITQIDILCDGITRQISTWNEDGTLLDELVASKVKMYIKEPAFRIVSDSGEIPLKERLTLFPDITHVDLIYNDGTHDYISVIWGGDDEFLNGAQKYEMVYGRLMITIEDE